MVIECTFDYDINSSYMGVKIDTEIYTAQLEDISTYPQGIVKSLLHTVRQLVKMGVSNNHIVLQHQSDFLIPMLSKRQSQTFPKEVEQIGIEIDVLKDMGNKVSFKSISPKENIVKKELKRIVPKVKKKDTQFEL